MEEPEVIIGAPAPDEPPADRMDEDAPGGRGHGPDDESAFAAERGRYAAAVLHLKAALAASEPGLDPALIAGDTVEEAEASFAAAREVLRRVREDVRREAAAAVPAGGTGRAPVARMTPFEKIRAGIVRLS